MSYLWSVLVCSKKPKGLVAPRCLAFKGDSKLPSGVNAVHARLLCTCDVVVDPEDSTSWKVAEYSFCVPADCHRMVFSAGTASVKVGLGQYIQAVDEYGARIANACVDREYPQWLESQRAALVARPVPDSKLLMSIVMPVYKTPPAFLGKAIQSVVDQTFGNWELVVVNASPDDLGVAGVLGGFTDPRIKVISCEENLGIAGNTNIGIKHCVGDYVSFFDHDDLLEPHALAEYVRTIEESGGSVGLLYCDEDNIDEEDSPLLPLFKPGYSPDFLLSNNYIIHWLTIRRDILGLIELPGKDVDGAQDYDMAFKAIEAGAQVARVPHVLYHWRIHSGSTAGDPNEKSYTQEAGLSAIRNHLNRIGAAATVERGPAAFTYTARFVVPSPAPDVIVCAPSGVSETTWAALERYSVAHGAKVAYSNERLADALASSDGEEGRLALTLTPQHVIDFDSLEQLVGVVSRDDVFAASPRVVRDDGLLDYAGSVVAPTGEIVRLLRYLPEADGGYVGRAQRPYEAFVLNGECCLFKVDALKELACDDRFSSDEYFIAEACAQAYSHGLRNVYLPYATARMSAPRSLLGLDQPDDAEGACLFASLHPEIALGDPSHNPNFDMCSAYYKIRRH